VELQSKGCHAKAKGDKNKPIKKSAIFLDFMHKFP
jgi:hypothetical protein